MADDWKKHFERQLSEIPSDWGLYQILDRGALSSSTYLDWAKEYYGLAALKPEYFSKNEVQFEVWDRWKDQIQANPELIPLCEWDGLLIVLCFEPPTQLNHSLLIPLLCDFSYMSTLWQTYQIHEQSKIKSMLKNDPQIVQKPSQIPPPLPTKNIPPDLTPLRNQTSPPAPPKKTQAS